MIYLLVAVKLKIELYIYFSDHNTGNIIIYI